MYNFDKITVKYFKDETIALEAFKAGEFDVINITQAKQWARDMVGKKFDQGILRKNEFQHRNNAGMQGFVMNLRRPLFQDIRVRKALGLAFDFEWTNSALFFDQYTRSNSYFSNSYLAATGLPEGLELTYLEEFRDSLAKEVFTEPLQAPVASDQSALRKNLRRAGKLLKEAGWTVKDGKLVNDREEEFTFEILMVGSTFSRVFAPYVKNLNRLGIHASYRTIDRALYVRRVQQFDFDMIVHTFGQSLSPGNEQRNYWSSAAADIEGSGNVIGIQDPVVDALVEKIIYASGQDELTAASRALDRVLWHGFYLVPNWYSDSHRMAYWNRFAMPADLPLFYNSFQFLMTWWEGERGKDEKLK
ncbi:unnamed protein product [Cyprideis torosa]|uniref:Uncharacterized protein n=1 Tax=Cyprideis torosa TaxID=163714 RepID=A0A7R8WY33_9CRUS|nr:unnamed protein product [Cyprideis torosa]CAG0909422.1 unnamed protein product [Cyprideis torosa]